MSIIAGGDVGADWVVAADVQAVTKDPDNNELYEWSLAYSEATGVEADRIGRETDAEEKAE